MAIVMMLSEELRTGPVAVCDHCRQLIARADDGNCEWAAAAQDVPTPIFTTHKRCSDPFRRAHPDVTQSMELYVLPIRLTASLDINHDRALQSAEALAGLA